jgi:hypothetical protein
VPFRSDEYFTESCELVPDGTGLPGSPATALSSFWTYPGCVAMTDHVFIISLQDGHFVKLIVDHYYNAESQEQCDTTGKVAMTGNGSAEYGIRWAYL